MFIFQFPYPVPTGNDPTKTLKSLVYIRKDSLRLVKYVVSILFYTQSIICFHFTAEA